MDDPWKHPAFAVAGIAAFVTADYTGPLLADTVGLANWAGAYIAAGLTGIVLGFIIDDMLPVYLEHHRGSKSNLDGGGDMDMDSGDLDF